ncbi:splicing factor 1 [Anaeramoeba flamelloides]|uniref:Splicing factor 1 n=1 Tax=Anaeramoeba flamelloides TaxID=1746091 RepID=A0ABQ8Y0M9_9EUKA|nr:splicing factor 1 [Anaeramoeba flamelloides]
MINSGWKTPQLDLAIPKILQNSLPEEILEAILLRVRLEEINLQLAKPSTCASYDLIFESEMQVQTTNPQILQEIAMSKLLEERKELIFRAKEIDPNFVPPQLPAEEGGEEEDEELIKRKVLIPEVRLVGILIGSKGSNIERIKKQTNTKIIVQGKGIDSKNNRNNNNTKKQIGNEPTHALIIGKRSGVDFAEQLVRNSIFPQQNQQKNFRQSPNQSRGFGYQPRNSITQNSSLENKSRSNNNSNNQQQQQQQRQLQQQQLQQQQIDQNFQQRQLQLQLQQQQLQKQQQISHNTMNQNNTFNQNRSKNENYYNNSTSNSRIRNFSYETDNQNIDSLMTTQNNQTSNPIGVVNQKENPRTNNNTNSNSDKYKYNNNKNTNDSLTSNISTQNDSTGILNTSSSSLPQQNQKNDSIDNIELKRRRLLLQSNNNPIFQNPFGYGLSTNNPQTIQNNETMQQRILQQQIQQRIQQNLQQQKLEKGSVNSVNNTNNQPMSHFIGMTNSTKYLPEKPPGTEGALI